MKRVILTLALLAAGAATSLRADSLTVFTLDDLYGVIAETHPVVRQASLLSEEAQQEIRFARGAFDPKLEAFFDRKEFARSEYFQLWGAQLKVPTWTGVDLKAGYDQTTGFLLNPADSTPTVGLAFAGVSVPLGQGLFTDVRRASLRQAQLFERIAEADQVKIINKVFFNAAKDYWEWFFTYRQLVYREEGYDLALVRFQGIRDRVRFGDLAPIDSVEAKINLQERTIALRQAVLELQQARLQISNYLWSPEGTPLVLGDHLIPEVVVAEARYIPSLDSLLNASAQHPDLVKLEFKFRQLEIEQRLQRELLKPVFNANVNFLLAPDSEKYDNELTVGYLSNNYKVGFEFSWPILLRKQRSKLQLTNLKALDTQLERQQRNLEVGNEVRQAYQAVVTLGNLLTQQREMVGNYSALLAAEVRKFAQGESSVFLINSRESKLIEAQVKLADLKTKYEKSLAELYYDAGVLTGPISFEFAE